MRDKRIVIWVAASLVVATLAAACGGTAAPTSPGKPAAAKSGAAAAPAAVPGSGPLQKVSLRLDWLASGEHAGVALAKTAGYYRKAGFAVHIGQGKGSALTVQTVGRGTDTFGLADAGTTALLISKGAPVKVLATFVQISPFSLIHMPDIKIASPRDLIGKTIVTTAGAATYTLMPAVLGTAGVKMSQVKFDFTDPNAYAGVMKRHPDHLLLGFDDDVLQSVQKVIPQMTFTPFQRFGVNLLNESLIASTSLIKQHPGEVRRFVAATVEGYQAALKDPAASVNAIMKLFPHADRPIEAKEVRQILTMLHTPASRGKVLGWAAPSDWQATVDLLHRYGSLKHVQPMSHYYTNAFLP